MTRQTRPLPPDLRPTGDSTDRPATVWRQEQPPSKERAPSNEALLALARLLGRQAARAYLLGGDDGLAGATLAGDPTDAASKSPCPATAQTDPASDP